MRVAVLAGGRSSEHDVSLASGAAICEGLNAAGHEVVAITIDRDGTWWMGGMEEARHGSAEHPIGEDAVEAEHGGQAERAVEAERGGEAQRIGRGRAIQLQPGGGLLGADVVFPALHGPFGEDGTIQGLLETLGVAYVGAGVTASAVCLDKVLFKRVLTASGRDMPQVGYVGVRESSWRAEPARVSQEIAGLGLPVFVKPAHLGSSVGIVRVTESDQVADALEQALAHDELAIVEAAAPGVEVECGILGLTCAELSGARTETWGANRAGADGGEADGDGGEADGEAGADGREADGDDGEAGADEGSASEGSANKGGADEGSANEGGADDGVSNRGANDRGTGVPAVSAWASEPGEIVLTGDWYDYAAKYTPGGMELIVPARISPRARARVQELALQAYTEVGCEGLARVDFFVDGDSVIVNELNTMPGFTPMSVYAKLMSASGIAYPDLLDRLCRLGIERHERLRLHSY